MADYFPATITIGGPATIEQLEQLAGIAERCDVVPDYSDIPSADYILKYALEAASNNEPLTLCSDQARYGCFEELEKWCRENDFPYQRHSDARYEYNAVLESWHPDLGDRTERSDQQANHLVDASEVRRIAQQDIPADDIIAEILNLVRPLPVVLPLVVVGGLTARPDTQEATPDANKTVAADKDDRDYTH